MSGCFFLKTLYNLLAVLFVGFSALLAYSSFQRGLSYNRNSFFIFVVQKFRGEKEPQPAKWPLIGWGLPRYVRNLLSW